MTGTVMWPFVSFAIKRIRKGSVIIHEHNYTHINGNTEAKKSATLVENMP